ncbi:MAG TPA: SDR family NAD(P)-dependent oxidoreductase [Pseudonocardiaceae bacterium]|jgi:NAD(P)-dependent dehydrogenase (short-subunit alcohol dehydrogenase family)|nr:SDR family NAD(P)-dependent oxidoreductase [Pseudonocardiaceae bacterium]
MKLTGRTVIVTGAASGIGREIARQFAAGGAIVLVTDLNASAVDAVVQDITAHGGNASGAVVDVTSREQLTAAVDGVIERHGALDYMVNNAGVAIFGDLDAVGLDEWDTIIDVNLRGVAYGTTIAYQRMVAQGRGHIVNTASVAGLVPVALQTHYCTTKHAIVGLCRTLRLEAADHNVRVTAFCPAWVESGMFDNSVFHGTLAGSDARHIVPIRPMPTARAVQGLMRGLDRGAELVITPSYGRIAWWLERFWPGLSHLAHRIGLRVLRARVR